MMEKITFASKTGNMVKYLINQIQFASHLEILIEFEPKCK